MNLLPKSAGEFGTTEYWDKFFKNRGKRAFEWYGEYPDLCGILHKYITSKNRILNIGCGNSKLSQNLYDVGIRNIVNIDVSPVVIRQMSKVNETRTEMEWHEMDATAMTFDADSFSVVLDKGTLDALFTDESEGTITKVRQYVNEVGRVLAQGGRYICISLLQSHIIRFIVQHFPHQNYMLRVIRCAEAEKDDGLPVFVIVATKFRSLPSKIYEISLVEQQIQRLGTPEEMVVAIENVQKSAMVTKGLSKDTTAARDEVELELFEPGNEIPRYTIHVVDTPNQKRGNAKFACFIVPQGRETEWMFATKKRSTETP